MPTPDPAPQFTLDTERRAFAIASGFKVQAVGATDSNEAEHPAVLVTVEGTDNDTREPTSHTVLLPASHAGQLAHELIRHANDATS